ncbi:M23 family metallopeptidase, partial [Actinotignum timonense]|uniref:M23 family metallopeptidase n=5 Tax=Actinomycetaceae TaxID=2049 RepID=UPI002A8086E4
ASGALIPPVPAPLYVTSPFGMRVYPFDGGWWMHEGVDLRSACGNPQYAAAAGVVAAVRPASGNGTHGNQVILNLGYINGSSYVVVYNHLSGFNVSVGQSVGQGDVIGWTGMTGMVTGCHVHFEVWQDGVVIDPMSLPGFYE